MAGAGKGEVRNDRIASAATFRCLPLALLSSAPRPLARAAVERAANALQGFSQNRDKPVQIEASTLEVRDKDKIATFSGNVHVVQGDTTMRCKSLVVFYEQNDSDADKSRRVTPADPGPGGQQRISKLEARGGVVVTQKDQTATGDIGLFDMQTNTVTLTGNVVITPGAERPARRSTGGGSDQRRLACRIRQDPAGRVRRLFLPGSVGPGRQARRQRRDRCASSPNSRCCHSVDAE